MKDLVSRAEHADFRSVIDPVTPDVFFRDYFEQKHLVIRREDRGYYDGLLSMADIDQVLTQMQLSTENLQMVKTGRAYAPDDYSMPNGTIDSVRVAKLFAEGATVILPGLQQRLPQLAAYCRSLETVFSCDLQTNIYLTPADAQGFRTHYDSHDVLVLQTVGSKTWRIYESALPLPLRSQPFKAEGFEPGKLIDTFVLRAGDMAYVPRGLVHDAIATDEVSLHITTGLLAPRIIDLMIDALIGVAHEDPALRRSIPPGFANDGFDLQGCAAHFARQLAEAAARIDAGRVLHDYAIDFRARRAPVVPGQFLQQIDAAAIQPGDRMTRRADLIYRLIEDADEVVLDIYGTEIALPAYAAPALRAAVTQPGFVVGELPGDLDAEGQAVLARRLVREGVLTWVRG